ncbi:MAG: LysR family transcriptional regulator [Oscillospiraceae bacterium]|nr:LysR family transcriptional regulator [Oscillospiraceae bacterium]
MQLDYIREFLTLAELGSYEAAAYRHFLTQSTLSKHIIQLEEALGGSLLSRGRHHAQLTPFGQAYLPYAKEIIRLHQSFLRENTNRSGAEPLIRLGYYPSMDAYGLFEQIMDFQHNIPECKITVDDELVTQQLQDDELDLVILFESFLSDLEYESIHLRTDKLALALPQDHPLASKPVISPSMLRDEIFVSFPRKSFLEQQSFVLCWRSGFEPKIVLSTFNSEILLRLVQQHIGIAILPQKMIQYWLPDSVVLRQLERSINLNICLIYKKNHNLSIIEQQLIHHLTV